MSKTTSLLRVSRKAVCIGRRSQYISRISRKPLASKRSTTLVAIAIAAASSRKSRAMRTSISVSPAMKSRSRA